MTELNDLSVGAKKILRYFKEQQYQQMVFGTPAEFQALFTDDEECENAQAELARHRLIELAPLPTPAHWPHRIQAAALTLDGVRFLNKNPTL